MTKMKIGRNDPCHCGSGQKYKRCCQEKDETAKRTARAAAEAAKPKPPPRRSLADLLSEEIDDDLVQLTESSNAVIKMVRAGQLDEAELAANELLVRFPEVHDGYDRLGMVAEARGDNKLAADYYRKVIDFARTHPDQYEPGFEDTFHRLIQKLDPAPAD
jgi:tetratricopeptide (TPR) repeat protein